MWRHAFQILFIICIKPEIESAHDA